MANRLTGKTVLCIQEQPVSTVSKEKEMFFLNLRSQLTLGVFFAF